MGKHMKIYDIILHFEITDAKSEKDAIKQFKRDIDFMKVIDGKELLNLADNIKIKEIFNREKDVVRKIKEKNVKNILDSMKIDDLNLSEEAFKKIKERILFLMEGLWDVE